MNSTPKLLASLKELGTKPNLTTFQDRKKNQKLAYLIQEVAGVPLGYSFTWYIRGPYSPDLTRDLFSDAGASNLNTSVLETQEREKVLRLKQFLGAYVESPDSLELLVSLHFLRKHGKRFGASKSEVIKALKERKPFFSDQDVEKSWLKLEELENY